MENSEGPANSSGISYSQLNPVSAPTPLLLPFVPQEFAEQPYCLTAAMTTDHDEGHSSLGDKLRQPFHELKEKLDSTHLQDAKVRLIHKKFVLGSAS